MSHGHHNLVRGYALLQVAFWISVVPVAARAELVLGICGGGAATADSDIQLVQGEGTRLTFRDVSWPGESFSPPLYYGLRVVYWFDEAPNWGIAVDFTHAKMFAERGRQVVVRGTRDGSPVDDIETLGGTFDELAFSHGYNLLTLNGTYRRFSKGHRNRPNPGTVWPYGSLGAGVVIPHVETRIAGVTTDGYQIAGLVLQGGAGAGITVASRLAFFAEYRLSYADVTGDLAGGGRISVQPWTSHFILGGSIQLSK